MSQQQCFFFWTLLFTRNFNINFDLQVSSHNKEGKRERYFADDDDYDLAEIVRREKMNTAEDYDAMFSRLSSKVVSKVNLVFVSTV